MLKGLVVTEEPTKISQRDRLALLALLLLALPACRSSKPEAGSSEQAPPTEQAPLDEGARARKRKIAARPMAPVDVSPDDPLKGKWSLENATIGLSGGTPLMATIKTDMGSLQCRLFDERAPITVANFVGLARGIRPWKTPEGKWDKKPAYDGTVFHRIIRGFMIQGGDAKKNGKGEAGYLIPDEIWEDANHDRAGLLCMANRGPNTNSAQFFITDGPAAHLDGGYTIFGECSPIELVHKLASVAIGDGDRPVNPPIIEKVSISGGPSKNAEVKATAPTRAGAPSPGSDLQQVFRQYQCVDGKDVVAVSGFDPCRGVAHLAVCKASARDASAERALLAVGCTRASSNAGAIDYCCPRPP